MEQTRDIRLKVQIMRYFIVNQQGFGAEIAESLNHTHADVFYLFESLENKKYIQPAVGDPASDRKWISARPRNYWRISQDIRVLKQIYDDNEFNDLRSEMRIQPWITKIATNKIQGFPPDIVTLISEMIITSPSFFEVMMNYETFDQMTEHYHSYFLRRIFFTIGADSPLINYWFLYQLCSECCIKDKKEGNPTEKCDGILNRMAQTLKSMTPVSLQEEYIRNLERVIFAIELILPYWGESHQGLKHSLEHNIGEFRDECIRARLSPEPNPENALFTSLYHVIIRELIDEKEGEPIDPLEGSPRPRF